MSAALPEIVDAWRMVQAGRRFQGRMPLASMSRLIPYLASTQGNVEFELEFGKDALGIAYVHVRADTALPLVCQRTLDVFELPVAIDARLGLITNEADEAGLPPGYEPLLTTDGSLHPSDVIEDELILAVPVVPVKPGTEQVERSWSDPLEEDPEQQPKPFAALQKLKVSRK
jgi:uncharacterized protein